MGHSDTMSHMTTTREEVCMEVAAELSLVEPEMTEEEWVEQAKTADIEAEAASAEAESPHRWRQADAYAALSEYRRSTRYIAEKCGTSHKTVSIYIKCVSVYPGTQARPLFTQAYYEAKGQGPGGTTSKEPQGNIDEVLEHAKSLRKSLLKIKTSDWAPLGQYDLKRSYKVLVQTQAQLDAAIGQVVAGISPDANQIGENNEQEEE